MASKQSKTLFVDEKLFALEKEGLYRSPMTVRVRGPIAIVDGKEALHLCSNDYLGLSEEKRVVLEAARALSQVSQCSSRLIAGNDPTIIDLEDMLAKHRGTESALVYPTGYVANIGAIAALAGGEKTTIFSDELNHASIIDACKLSDARIEVFPHLDTEHLENLVSKAVGRKIIITEGIFSMDGDSSNVGEICKIAEKHDALTVIDDAHGDFIFGPKFSGIPAKFSAKVDVHISSMSKGLGCFGGYVATSARIREFLVNTSRQFIYTSALPDHLCVAAATAIPMAKKGGRQKRLFANITQFSTELKEQGFTFGNSSSQIIPIIIGDEKKTMSFSNELLKESVFAQAVRYPTVKKSSARIRVSLTALHRKAHIERAIDAFAKAGRKSGII